MRSFASVILHLLAQNTPTVLLLDEPEAFLHPPQARLLGEFIATEKPERAQLFVATHSADVLQGLLSSASDHVRLVRIQRDGDVNRVKELDKARTKEIGTDPLMKFSNVLSGIFYQRVCASQLASLPRTLFLASRSEDVWCPCSFSCFGGASSLCRELVPFHRLETRQTGHDALACRNAVSRHCVSLLFRRVTVVVECLLPATRHRYVLAKLRQDFIGQSLHRGLPEG